MDSIIDLNKRGSAVDFTWLKDLEKILKSKKLRLDLKSLKKYISLALVSKKEIKELNNVYRNKDSITDVLSFNLDTKEVLGEVVICLDQAKKQAKEKKNSIKSELKLLTIHGILHLLGYDHEISLKEAEKQENKEKEILELLK